MTTFALESSHHAQPETGLVVYPEVDQYMTARPGFGRVGLQMFDARGIGEPHHRLRSIR
jgi:hypothetical protein